MVGHNHASSEAADASLRPAKLAIIALVALAIIATLIFASLPMKVLALVMGLGTLQGLWRGAVELTGLVLGMVLAIILARPLGIALEGATRAVFGTGGMLNRGLSMALVVTVVTIAVAIAFKLTAGRKLQRHEPIAKFDKLAGAAVGLVEGSIVGLALLWVPLALEPVATAQLAARDMDRAMPPNPIAERVLDFAHQVRASSLGTFAEATNPAQGISLLALANEAAALLSDPAKFERFMQSDAVARLQALASFNQALDMMNTDREIGRVFDAKELDADVIRQLAESDTMLHIMDETTLIADVEPLVADIRQAIAEAAADPEDAHNVGEHQDSEPKNRTVQLHCRP